MKKTVLIFKRIIQLNIMSLKALVRFFIRFLFSIFFCFQIVHADTDVIIKSAKVDLVNVYSGSSSSKKTKDTIAASDIDGKKIIVTDQAMNGRFLKIKYKGKDQWIKAKQVKTTQKYDVGACEVQNKATGVRAAVNCTK